VDQHRARLRLPFDDVDLDDAPGLTVRDQAALEAIRRRLETEYPGTDEIPSLSLLPAVVPRVVPARARWRWPVIAALVALAAVAGGVVGALVTARVLSNPVTVMDTPIAAPLRPPEVTAGIPLPAAVAEPTPRAARPEPPRPGSPRAADAAPDAQAAVPATVRAEARALSRPDATPQETPASASPRARRQVTNGTAPATRTAVPEEPRPPSGPEPQAWSDPLRPLNAETPAPAGVVKAAFRSSAALPVPAPAPPPVAPPLSAATAVARESLEPVPGRGGDPRPADAPAPINRESVLTNIRDDWETVKSGFASAPDDFREAWRSLQRDFRSLFLER
jgi:hypothetical protein